MKSSVTSLIKFSIFIFVGIVFGGSLVVYSNSRGTTGGRESGDTDEFTNTRNDDPVRRYEKQFSVQPGGTVKVDADAGTVTIDSWEKNEVSVVVEIEGSENRVSRYTVDFKQDGNTVIITGRVRDKGFFGWGFGNLSAVYTIHAPKQFSSDVETSGGDVEVREMNGTTKLSTSGGNVSVEKIEGYVSASTSGGNVDVTGVVGNVDAETSGGTVRCRDVTGAMHGETSGGDVVADNIDGMVTASTSGGSIRIKVRGENRGISAETSGGDIDIAVKDDITATVEAQTSGGDVDCDMPVVVRGKVQSSELNGTINGGGKLIHAETSGGSIRISRIGD